jgi:hypothetical protein
MSTTELITFKFRRGTSTQWTAANSILAQGEPGYETDTGLLKMGNGITSWNNLGYFNTSLNPNGSIFLGSSIGNTAQGVHSIILNASGVGLTSSTAANAFYVKPIRTDLTQTSALCYNSTTGEIVVGTSTGGGGTGGVGILGATGATGTPGIKGDTGANGLSYNMNATEIQIGYGAGSINQQTYSVAIGNLAGNNAQQISSVALGDRAGEYNQQVGSVAVGFFSGNINQQSSSVAVGPAAGDAALFVERLRAWPRWPEIDEMEPAPVCEVPADARPTADHDVDS